MKKIALILYTIIFSLLFPTSSNADWKQVWNSLGDTYYLDFEKIKKSEGYVYYWQLLNYVKPDESGYLSSKGYTQGDCQTFRFKFLSSSLHKERMGIGTGEVDNTPDKTWTYPSPNSVFEDNLKSVCKYAQKLD